MRDFYFRIMRDFRRPLGLHLYSGHVGVPVPIATKKDAAVGSCLSLVLTVPLNRANAVQWQVPEPESVKLFPATGRNSQL
jgi:hypothetical protein